MVQLRCLHGQDPSPELPALPSVVSCLLLTESSVTLCPPGAAQGSAGVCAGAEHRLKAPGVQHTFLAGGGDRAGVWLGPAHRAACSASSRAGERFRQPGRPAEQRREVKPAWVNGDTNPARLCFISLPLRQQVPAGRDWELVSLFGIAELVNC